MQTMSIAYNVPSLVITSVYYVNHAAIERIEKADEITNRLKRFLVSHNKFLYDVRRHNKSVFSFSTQKEEAECIHMAVKVLQIQNM